MGFIEDKLSIVSKTLSIDLGKYIYKVELINFVACMISTFPLGYFNRFIKNRTIRLYYGLITGLILQYYMYGVGK
jgi:hypothetical protein